MTASISLVKPKLRPLDPRPIRHRGESYILLRDPLGLSPDSLLVPEGLAAVLPLLDGTRQTAEVSVSLAVRFGLNIPSTAVADLVAALDDAYLLENDRAAAVMQDALAAYRSQPFRPPALAGSVYPAKPGDLTAFLGGFMDQAGPETAISELPPGSIRGLVSPHIDYARGGEVYAGVWGSVAAIVRSAELVVILGTDHQAPAPSWTLTTQHYATPFGVLPTDQDAVEWMAAGLGSARVFADELHHRQEHSIELAAVWLHHIREGQPCKLVPVLCGSFNDFIQTGRDPATDPTLSQAVQRLKEYCTGKRTLIIAAGDLSHVGPAFGGYPLDDHHKVQLKTADDALIGQICAGDGSGFFQAIRQVGDRNNVCGLAPIFLALKMMGPVKGLLAGYGICPADEAVTSVVSICGVVFQGR